MFSNEEILNQEENVSEYSQYRDKMNKIRKWNNIAFFSNIPFFIGQFALFLGGIASLNMSRTLFNSLFMMIFCAFFTLMSTYKKNKYFAYGTFIFYFLTAPTGLTFLAIPVFIVYPVFIKSLYDEDKLKLIDGYPYFNERGSTYREIYGIEEGSMKDMTYKNPERDNIEELPENIELYKADMFATDNLYMDDAPDTSESDPLPASAEHYSGLTFISDNLYMEDVSVEGISTENK